jgi:hypothetical protein
LAEVVVGGEALTLVMMISKLAWTASEDDEDRSIFCLFVLPSACPFTRFSTGLFLGISLIPSDDFFSCSERIIQFPSYFAAYLTMCGSDSAGACGGVLVNSLQ